MKTSTDVIKDLQSTIEKLQTTQSTLDDLIAAHDYQDVAMLIMQSSEALLNAAIMLMQSDDEEALNLVETAEDMLEEMYNIIEGDLDS